MACGDSELFEELGVLVEDGGHVGTAHGRILVEGTKKLDNFGKTAHMSQNSSPKLKDGFVPKTNISYLTYIMYFTYVITYPAYDIMTCISYLEFIVLCIYYYVLDRILK